MRVARNLLLIAGIAALAIPLASGCAHAPSAELSAQRAERRLLVLEEEFSEFIARDLARSEDGARLDPDEAIHELDQHIARLQALRLRYLDLVGEGSSDRQRVVAMVRIAELHLDLGARVRRLPYPADATVEQMVAFDERLGRIATPLEAVGYGVLRQVDDYADRRRFDGRFVRRAHLYLALHQDGSLHRRELVTLRAELARSAPYGAPRRLLEAGRVGQRASRR